MASRTVAVRLAEEVLEQLQQRAAKEDKIVSELVRELILKGLAKRQGQVQGAAGGEVLARLEKLDKRLERVLGKYATDAEQPVAQTTSELEAMEARILSLLAALGKLTAQGRYYARAAAIASCEAARTMEDNEWPDDATRDNDIVYYDATAEKAAEDFLAEVEDAVTPVFVSAGKGEDIAETLRRLELVQRRLLRGAYLEAVMARYYSRMTAQYAIDIEALMEHKAVSSKEAREAILAGYDKGALEKATSMWELFVKTGKEKKEAKD